ncbi:hypothetical protein [Mycobacterium canetti]|nr:hypothetical protein [Mycobacterium canetti]
MDSPCDDNGQEVWTSQMIVAPAFVDAAAKGLFADEGVGRVGASLPG